MHTKYSKFPNENQVCNQDLRFANAVQDQRFVNAGQDQRPIKQIAARLYAAKRHCGPKATLRDKRHYLGIAYELPPGIEGARLLYAKLGVIPPGHSLDRIDPRGAYSLENIRYADAAMQTANRVIHKRVIWKS